MALKLSSATIEWILQQMESLTKTVMNGQYVQDTHHITQKIGQFRAYKELLSNSGYESYGIEFKVKLPTNEEYANSLSD